MKLIIAITFVLFYFNGWAQDNTSQDTTKRHQESLRQDPPATKTSTPTNNPSNSESNPIMNKIAVSDPGMPPEKPTPNSKAASTKPTGKKKRSNSGVNPK